MDAVALPDTHTHTHTHTNTDRYIYIYQLQASHPRFNLYLNFRAPIREAAFVKSSISGMTRAGTNTQHYALKAKNYNIE